jgi:FlaA1/EpsC-like NDP-sugar epimerase
VLCHEHGFDGAVPVLADLRSIHRTFELLMRYRPRVVFHTAAYKQVPLAEEHVVEAVGTNVLATRWAVEAAVAAEVDRFVLFSTDKAVRPTSVLGQTKAVAEWIVARAGLDSAHTRFASVRLGNVVDSSGSMLPLFRRQIARGGPVTVTHPETTRYLMTAGEAAGLALAAVSCADADGCFWLDLGRPVRILDLANRVIASSGADVPVAFVGLRPGERMHERFRESGDDAEPTSYPRVFRSTVRAVDGAWLDEQVSLLSRLVEHASADGTRARLAAMHAEARRETARRSAAVP